MAATAFVDWDHTDLADRLLLLDLHEEDDDTDGESSIASFPSSCFPIRTESSRTSYDLASARSPSPTPSVFSVTSSVRAQAFRELHGRAINNYSDVYCLAADEKEMDRLDMQHELFKVIMGKYPPPMTAVLADVPFAEQKAVLDLGCGSGSWVADVARDYPHVSCVGVDLVPIQSEQDLPPNMRSEVDDVNLGLEHFYGDFDVVHCRLISSGIKDYAALIDQASRILRPRGMIDIMEFDFRVYGYDRKPIEVDTTTMEAPWFPRWMRFLRMAVQQLGGDVDAANHLDRWIGTHGAFEDTVYREFFIQTAPWTCGNSDRRAEAKREQGVYMRADIKEFIRSGRPLLLGSGIPESLLGEIEQNAYRELDEANTPHYIRCQYVYARKRLHPLLPPSEEDAP